MDAPLPTHESDREKDIRLNKDIAAVSYLWVMALLIYIARKDSPFVQYHSKQALVLFAISIPLWFIPGLGQFFELFLLAGGVMGFLNAFQGRYSDVPIAGKLSRGELTPAEAMREIIKAARDLWYGIFPKNKNTKSSSPSNSPPPSPPPLP
jgi:uncharacterized membrane protein